MVTLSWLLVMIRKIIGRKIRSKRKKPPPKSTTKRDMAKEAKKIVDKAIKNKKKLGDMTAKANTIKDRKKKIKHVADRFQKKQSLKISRQDYNKLKDMAAKEKALNKEKKAQALLKKGSFKKVRKEVPLPANENIREKRLKVVSSSEPKKKKQKKRPTNKKLSLTEKDVMGQIKRGVSPTTARKEAEKRAYKRGAIAIPPVLNYPPKEAEDILTHQLLRNNKNMTRAEARKQAKAHLKKVEEERKVSAEFKKGFQDVSDKELKAEDSKKSGGKVYKRKKGGKVMSGQDLVNSFYD